MMLGKVCMYIWVLLFFVSTMSFGKNISGKYVEMPLPQVLMEIQEQTDFSFFFQKKELDSSIVTLNLVDISIENALNKLLVDTDLTFSIIRGTQVYITKSKLVPINLVLDTLSEIRSQRLVEENAITNSEQRYLVGRKSDVMKSITIGEKRNQGNAKFVTLRVSIKDEEKGEPLFSASMFIDETGEGAVTDINGNLILALKPGETYTATFSTLGMQKLTIQLVPYESGNLDIALTTAVVAIKEVTIKADQQEKLYGVNVGMEKISMKNIKELPSLMGEKDVVKISQFLPGIQTVGEGSSGVYIRGGNADQNMFYINGIPVYNTSHLFGFFSAFNSTLVSGFSIYKGHIPALYGGRLSSIFDISTRQGNTKQFSARGGISPVSVDLITEIPIVKEKASVVLSARSSYSDWILRQLKDPDLRNSKAGFYDLAASLNYKINTNNFVKGFGYYSQDNFTLSDLQHYDYQNMGASAQWVHYFSSALSMDVSGVMSNYQFATQDYADVTTAYSHSYNIHHNEAKLNFKWKFNPKHNLEMGSAIIQYQLDRGDVLPYGSGSLRNPVNLGTEQGVESAVYASDLYTPFTWLTAYAGIRFSLYNYIGPAEVNLYRPGVEIVPENITGQTTYGKGEVITTHPLPEIRLSINIRPWDLTSLKLAYNTSSQNLFMLSNTVAIAPNDQWKLSDAHLDPARGKQLSLGVLQELPFLGLSLSAEVYRKTAANIVAYKDGADFLSTKDVETLVLQGDQDAYGIELMAKKNTGNLTGWISYTYSRSLITIDGKNDWEKINDGESYPANYDIPHSANLIANYRFNRRFSFSTNWLYKTGRPITYPQAIYYIDEKEIIDYSDRNAYRIPDYFRIDASVSLEGNLKKDKKVHSLWMLSVYNVTGRDNAYSVFFKMENGKINGYKYSVVGVPIVTLKWIFKLGNYATE